MRSPLLSSLAGGGGGARSRSWSLHVVSLMFVLPFDYTADPCISLSPSVQFRKGLFLVVFLDLILFPDFVFFLIQLGKGLLQFPENSSDACYLQT